MLNIVCVLRSGGEYHQAHVISLRDRVAKFLTLPYRFVCLSDVESPHYEVIRLEHNWPGWWSKIELFRPGLFDGPVFYADLDTVPVGPLDDLVQNHRFTVLRNFWVGPEHPRIGSGLMAWDEDMTMIYRDFAKDPGVADQFKTKEAWGDQGFIQRYAALAHRWQQRRPDQVVSYKLNCKYGVPKDAKIVCFHGRPRPWHTALGGWACSTTTT